MAVKGKAAKKIRFVHVPADGDPGLTFIVSPSALTFNTSQSAVRFVSVEVFRGGRKLQYQDEFMCSVLSSSSTVTQGLTWGITMDSGTFRYRLSYAAGNNISLTIPFVITVDGVEYPASIVVQTVRNGNDGSGADGNNGVWVPPTMLWEDYPDDYQFQAGDPSNGDVRLDMVLVRGSGDNLIPYYCLVSHVKEYSPTSPQSDSVHWAPSDAGVYKCLATELLAATNARIDFLSGQAIRVGNGAQMCGYFGAPTATGAVLFSGAASESQATFVVYSNGRVVATNMHISGNSTFKGFILREKTLITSSNYASMSKQVEYLPGTTQSELDLIKTGNWMEIKSLPTQSSTYLLRLPAIRTGVAYTDAYRDYVRQFLGNELLIYNSSGKTVNVDSGESSRIIPNGYAVHFKMIFTPEKSTSGQDEIWLEKIRWEYTEPYQF